MSAPKVVKARWMREGEECSNHVNVGPVKGTARPYAGLPETPPKIKSSTGKELSMSSSRACVLILQVKRISTLLDVADVGVG
jgi:hypothetical protein